MKFFAILIATWPTVALTQNSVHLQYAFKGETRKVAKILDLRKRDAERRKVYLFDSFALDLYHHNIQIRIRLEDDRAQLAVKRWGLTQTEFNELQGVLGTCEIDVHGPVEIRACGVKFQIPSHEADLVLNGKSVLSIMNDQQRYLLTKAQMPSDLFAEVVPLGPVESLAWSWRDADENKYGIDIHQTPDAFVFRELTVKTTASHAIREWLKVREELSKRGLDLSRKQHGRRLEKLTGLIHCARALQQ